MFPAMAGFRLARFTMEESKERIENRIEGGSRFPKQSRLLSARDYSPVFSDPKWKISSRHLLILAKPAGPSGRSRLGIVVARKNVAKAVQRNRIKRIIRESFRVRKSDFGTIDLVVLVRRGLDTLENSKIHHHIDSLFDEIVKKLHKPQGR